MQHSTERILTTHVGSLVRPPRVQAIMSARQVGQPFSDADLEAIKQTVTEAVREQAACGIDIPSDGEHSKSSFSFYVSDRLTGFENRPPLPGQRLFDRGRDRKRFAEAYVEIDGQTGGATGGSGAGGTPVCTGPITYRGQELVAQDLARFREALAGQTFVEAFVPAVGPATIELQRRNEYYPKQEDFLFAIAEAMRTEYQLIIDAGFILQIDDPRLVTEFDSLEPAPTYEEYARFAALRLDALNHALRGLPADRIRFHMCWGSWHGPHSTDIPISYLINDILRLNAGGFSLEAANPRHEHEYHIWETVKLPNDAVLIPGVVAHTTNHVEHPELIAERLVTYARLVGRENVIAGADCGFAQGFGYQRVHPTIMWEKFRMLAEGARLATQALW